METKIHTSLTSMIQKPSVTTGAVESRGSPVQPDHIKFLDFDPTSPQRALDLDAIRARAKRCKEWLDESARQLTGQGWLPLSVREFFARDIKALLAEVTALRELGRAALKESETEITALRAELDAARAERTEPATGEDELLALIHEASGVYQVDAPAILAALDLPGRERALREAEREVHLLGADLHTAEVRIASLKEDHQEIETWLGRTTGLAPTDEDTCLSDWVIRVITAERDAANAALADVAQKLDEARAEAEALRSQHVLGAQLAHLTRSLTEALAERDQARDDLARWHKKEAGNE